MKPLQIAAAELAAILVLFVALGLVTSFAAHLALLIGFVGYKTIHTLRLMHRSRVAFYEAAFQYVEARKRQHHE